AGGLDCLSCHGIGPKGATKVFEAPAPNFKVVRARLRKDYYDRWVREPLRLEPGTKMPQFIKDGRTQLTEILDGDGVKQADALWQFLLEGDRIRPPPDRVPEPGKGSHDRRPGLPLPLPRLLGSHAARESHVRHVPRRLPLQRPAPGHFRRRPRPPAPAP